MLSMPHSRVPTPLWGQQVTQLLVEVVVVVVVVVVAIGSAGVFVLSLSLCCIKQKKVLIRFLV